MRAPGDRTPPSRHLGNGIRRPGRVSDDDVAGPAPSAAPSGPPSRRRARARRRRGPPPRRVPARPFGRQGHRPPGRARACGRDARRRRPPAPRTRCTAPGQPATGRARPRCRRGRRQWPGEQRDARRPRAFLGAHPGVVHRGVRRADAGPGGGMVRDPGGRARARGGSDGFRQDPRRLSVGPRPADVRASTREPGAALPGAVRVAAEGPRRRRRAQPALAAGRDPAGGGLPVPEVVVGVRTGDTPPGERRAFGSRPPDVLITTPESLYLVLTSAARAGLSGIRTVILDEIHAVAGTKRGAHLALSLERLDALLEGGPGPAQRIGLSATVRPVESVAGCLSGARPAHDGGRTVTVVQPPVTKQVEVQVVVPVPDLTDLTPPAAPSDAAPDAAPRPSIWPHVEERVVDLVAAHRSTLVFTNSRRGAERLTARMNEVWAARQGAGVPDPGTLWAAQVTAQSGTAVGIDTRDASGILARAHHGSMSRAERTRTETELKSGHLPAVVATSSLELGIDMGAVDLVVQVGAPPSVASGLDHQ